MLKLLVALGLASTLIGLSLPVSAEPLAETYSPDDETIVGGRAVYLPSVPVTPARYALPMIISIVQDSSITEDAPLFVAYGDDFATWSAAIESCLDQRPAMYRQTVSGEVPFLTEDNIVFDEAGTPVMVTEGTIVLNANGNPVCPQ